jgi:hypothetical protein
MSQPDLPDILIRIDSIDQLFNASSVDAFSEKPIVILGEAGLSYTIRQAMSQGLRSWHGKRLVIQLPPEQVTPGLQAQVENGIHNFARQKIIQNNAIIRLSRVRALIGLVMAVVISVILLAILTLLLGTLLAAASDTVKGLLVGLVTIFVWSTVWNPWDRLVYEWIEPWRENRILRKLISMSIVVQAESAANV